MKTQANLHDHVLSTLSTNIRTTPSLTVEQIAQYHRDKYVIIRKLFDLEDIEPFRKAGDPDMQGVQAKINDKAGEYFKVALWSELGDILLGVMPRMARMVDAVEMLLAMECYHWHAKIVRKLTNDGQLHFH